MFNQKKFIVSHAPFWHDESKVSIRYYNILLATLPAVLFGIIQYGMPALAVVSLSVSSAIFWELLMNRATKRPVTITDGNAALIGMLFAMLLPASSPWWLVITGTFVAIVVGKHIYGGIGANPFNPALVAIAILTLSWKGFMNFDQALLNFNFDFNMAYPLAAVKRIGSAAAASFSAGDLLLGRQSGGLGATFGLGLILGGLYLILRGFIRWEISFSFLAAIFITALVFHLTNSGRFAGPVFHLLTGNTILGAFFLATEDSSSPVNFIPMLIYGAGAGVLIMLIRNIGGHADGVVFAILLMNLANPLLDKIRPKALGKVNSHA
ncbi:MAG: RnfABCDGE type electron transport complex subunit D [Thermodesulfobacteriota bacterium]